MAERRMFNREFMHSDAFMDLPCSSQMLYVHACLSADDDGFFGNPKRLLRMCGASDGDLEILCSKGFLHKFDSGVVVVMHWKLHNYLRMDRYKPTVYYEEKSQLSENFDRSYRLCSCTDLVYQLDTQNRREESREDENKCASSSSRFDEFWAAYPKHRNRFRAEQVWNKLMPTDSLADTILNAVESQKHGQQWTVEDGKFIPDPASWLTNRRWEDEVEEQHQDSKHISRSGPTTDILKGSVNKRRRLHK